MIKLTEIMTHMGPPAIAVATTLLLMALASVAVFFERLVSYGRSRATSRRFARQARQLMENGKTSQIVHEATMAKPSHLAKLLSAGVSMYEQHRKKASTLSAIEATRRELDRRTEVLTADVRRGMGVLASVGSIAPFVGLLGTVFGIITSFQGIAKEGSGGLGAVSMGISEALYETALGLVVAIPAVLMYNWLSTQGDRIILALEQAKGEFIDFLEAQEGLKPHGD